MNFFKEFRKRYCKHNYVFCNLFNMHGGEWMVVTKCTKCGDTKSEIVFEDEDNEREV